MRSMLQASAASRRVSEPVATYGVAYAFVVTMIGTTLPTPLYPIYERQMHFSGLIVTVVFATYAIGVISALLLVGQRSDQIGRRPVLFGGLAFSAASSVVFLFAGSLGPLLVGRILSGLSAGIFTGTATAAIADLAPADARGRATAVSIMANLGGLGLGSLLAGVLAQVAPHPLRLPYAVQLAMLVPAVAAIWLMPEPVEVRPRARFRIQRLRVPREVRATFVRASAASFAGFAVLGLFSAVVPSFLGEFLKLPSHALSGVVVFVMFASATVGQLAVEHFPGHSELPAGCVGMIFGAGLIAWGIAASSLGLLIAGGVIAALGFGLSFRSGLAAITDETPGENRGEVASSFFVISYIAISIPIVGVGVVSEVIGLRSAGLAFTGVVAAIALGAALSLAGRLQLGSE